MGGWPEDLDRSLILVNLWTPWLIKFSPWAPLSAACFRDGRSLGPLPHSPNPFPGILNHWTEAGRSRSGQNFSSRKSGKVKTVMQITSICLYIAHGAIQNDLSKVKSWSGLSDWAGILNQSAQLSLIFACVLTVYSGCNYLSSIGVYLQAESPKD
jgi:hypothetical protein